MSGPIPTKTINQLTALLGNLTGDELLEVWSANTSRRIRVRQLAMLTDPFLTAVPYGSVLPFSRYLQGSASIQIVDGGPAGPMTLVASTASSGLLPAGLTTIAPAAGNVNDQALAIDQGYLDINTAAGNINLTGIVSPIDGLVLIVSNTGPNLLQLMSLNGLSAAANQFRLPFDMGVTTNGSIGLRYSAAIGKWVQIT